ncbi:two pore domain potassium channel family protein [Candidatus Bipolaricaulota bacterium]|nr:two pore domain potassium channel family protein [Candidatus Bipolaricaulota bacterium]
MSQKDTELPLWFPIACCSVYTFVTLGYGDVHPVPGLGAALAATEAVLGSIMMVFTILVIGHKFMR